MHGFNFLALLLGLVVSFGMLDISYTASTSQLDDISCTVCIDSADYIHENPNASFDDVKDVLSQRCKKYNQYSDVCQNTLDTFLPDIFPRAHNPFLSSQNLCLQMNLCANKGNHH